MRKIVHIGAHRTGTTSIQTALYENEDQLYENGITAITAVGAREILFDPLLKYTENTGDKKQELAEHLHVVADEIAEVSASSSTVIYSEENLLGDMDVIFDGEKFGHLATQNLTALSEFIGDDFEIVMAIREYASYFNSIYTYRFGKTLFEPFEHYKGILLNSKFGWNDLVQDIGKILPNTKITIMPFENYNADFSTFFSILGIPDHIDLQPKHINQTRSSLAIRRLQKRILAGEELTKEQMMKLVRRTHKFPHVTFETWSDAEKEELLKRYQADIDKIKSHPNVNFIE